ncbi:uncharacterized protein A1O9_09187 [Exophiala aquamarina CBS 119918]|uniref:ASST-domain-containing protein n=1 Tax=Exophiala aquamarina CBS 119918 TaxID=1182545 RepID=A0A072PGT4_9EURO|nr:uncharacterized protein A1O9_09187 [Exophiala aquamarina CBS 119918]KEF54745.1 hypothetical protein A1O9_09187 [Exophiala aquamarina CBS 119918]
MLPFFILLIALWYLSNLMLRVNAQGQPPIITNNTGPLSQYKSKHKRPDIYAPSLNITLYEEHAVTPGKASRYMIPEGLVDVPSIHEGRTKPAPGQNLVYSGYGSTGGGPSHNFHVCSISGADSLCFITGGQNHGYSRGWAMVLDDTFTARSSIHSQGGLANLDEHEFNVLPDGTALFTLYSPQPVDLTAYGISNQGWVQNTYFQHIELSTNQLIFEWSPVDHVSLDESWVSPNTTDVSGDGLTPTTPWDFFHMNSVDRNADGDYLVSARHTSTIYKISGQSGHIIWRLGGALSDFSFPPGLNFSFQHDARFREENATTAIISLFDNASNGFNQSSRYSTGMILKLDYITNSTTLLQEFVAPDQFISASQGNVQFLGPSSEWQTSNKFIGWGSNAYISEYTSEGRMVLQGHFATTGAMNYRAFKHNFTSKPTDTPALYAYAHNESATTSFWVSWNGATEVVRWRIYGSASSTGPWSVIDTFDKNGFETLLTVSAYYPWSIVESLDTSGNAIRNSSRAVRTFVPGPRLASVCDALACPSTNSSASSQSPPASTSSTQQLTNTISIPTTVTETQTIYLSPTAASAAVHGKQRDLITTAFSFVMWFYLGAMM